MGERELMAAVLNQAFRDCFSCNDYIRDKAKCFVFKEEKNGEFEEENEPFSFRFLCLYLATNPQTLRKLLRKGNPSHAIL